MELELKYYIAEALELVTKRVGGKIPFKIKGDDFLNAPLGDLIKTFQKLSDCPRLVQRLNDFKKERNFVAHRVISDCTNLDGDLDRAAAKRIEPRLQSIEAEAKSLTEAIHEEHNKFLGHLYFGDFENL